MSYLVVTTLNDEIEQPLNLVNNKRYPVRSIAFHLYLNDPSPGSVLTIKVKDSDDVVIATEAVPIATIIAQLGATDTYSHGKYQWQPSNLLLGQGEYKLSLEQTTGYASWNYIGWCKEWASDYTPVEGSVTYSSDKPYYFRLYTYKERI